MSAGSGTAAADLPRALLALLVARNRRVPARAAAATLLDLAARGVDALEGDGRGRRWIRAAGAGDPRLRGHEWHVHDHLVARARLGGGRVPEAARGPRPPPARPRAARPAGPDRGGRRLAAGAGGCAPTSPPALRWTSARR